MLEIRNINVNFFSKEVLKNVSLAFEEGKIHALFGENGAGKSTLAKVLCGDLIPSAGEIYINNNKVFFSEPKDAIKNGICCVHQRPLLADSISIKENILLGAPKVSNEKIQNKLKEFIPEKNHNSLVKNLTGAQRFFVSLCCALLKNPKYLILDEPTIFLDPEQRILLFSKLKDFTKNGMTIIIITHIGKDIIEYTDTTTFINDGVITNQFVDSKTLQNISDFSLSLNHKNHTKNQNFFIEYKNLTHRPINKPSIFDVSFSAISNEITLIKGLKESGIETLEDAITGMASSPFKGTIVIVQNKKEINIKEKNEKLSTKTLRNHECNFAIIPSNKTFRASNPNLTVLQLVCCYKLSYKQKDLIKYTNKIINKARINTTYNQKAKTLSGGMLQRLILERELDTNPKILILCESLQGLDKQSSLNFCNRILDYVSKGNIAIALHNSEFPEDICNSVYILNNGYCTKEK